MQSLGRVRLWETAIGYGEITRAWRNEIDLPGILSPLNWFIERVFTG